MISFHIQKLLQGSQGNFLLQADCDIPIGQLTTLFGASGAGKTTILKILAGLLPTTPQKGFIKFGENVWLDTDKKINIPPQKRSIGFVFQDYALFPNKTVRGNLEYALEKGANQQIIADLMAIMELNELQNRFPDTLSGGQKQRVALARALVRQPQLLLLDEPLSALDTQMRHRLQQYILLVHKTYNLTTILVSHDIAEIYKMADTVIVLENGLITNQGHPNIVFDSPKTSSNFCMIGEVLKIEKVGIDLWVTILISNNVVRITAAEITELEQGDTVMITEDNFRPHIKKIG